MSHRPCDSFLDWQEFGGQNIGRGVYSGQPLTEAESADNNHNTHVYQNFVSFTPTLSVMATGCFVRPLRPSHFNVIRTLGIFTTWPPKGNFTTLERYTSHRTRHILGREQRKLHIVGCDKCNKVSAIVSLLRHCLSIMESNQPKVNHCHSRERRRSASHGLLPNPTQDVDRGKRPSNSKPNVLPTDIGIPTRTTL